MILIWNLTKGNWPVTKLEKKNKIRSKIIDDDVMSENCDAIAIL